MRQAELFVAADLAQPAPKKAAWPAPVPENIRRHLERMLADARWAHEMPWRDWELASLTENYNAMADRLGEEESATWREQWQAEINRLQRAAA